MLKIERITVKKNERALLLRNGDFERVLGAGTHWLFGGLDQLRVETFPLDQTAFRHALADYLMAKEPEVVAAEFVRVELSEGQVGLRSENGVLVEMLPPGTRRLYWKGLVEVAVQVVELQAGAELPAGLVARLTQSQLRNSGEWPGRCAAGASARRHERAAQCGRQGRSLARRWRLRLLEIRPHCFSGDGRSAFAGARGYGPGHHDP